MSDIAIIMGSDSDWPIMEEAAKVLDKFSISYSAQVLSAHRMPVEMVEFAKNAQSAGYKVIIAGAGGAAHLPGMVASLTTLPVIGVPVSLKNLDGMDSLLSIVQMPAGIPVATVAIDNAANAAILAARILGISDETISQKVGAELKSLNESAKEKGASLQSRRNQKTGFQLALAIFNCRTPIHNCCQASLFSPVHRFFIDYSQLKPDCFGTNCDCAIDITAN